MRRAQRTSVSAAIDAAANLFDSSGLEATRKVIDVSGDGANNQGRPVTQARDEAIARGITINGLPIMLKKPGSLDDPDLDLYFRDCVIGGPGAFMVPARERSQFQLAIKTKILLEVSAAPPVGEPLVRPAQGDAARRANCLCGRGRVERPVRQLGYPELRKAPAMPGPSPLTGAMRSWDRALEAWNTSDAGNPDPSWPGSAPWPSS